jgi:hypothetical protein
MVRASWLRTLMEIENLIRYSPLAVGLKPSAIQGEARLRGLYQIIYSKTISETAAEEADRGEVEPVCSKSLSEKL